MKKTFIYLFACAGLMLASCNNSSEKTATISDQEIQSVVGQLADFQKGNHFTTVATGYYELNDSESREKLRQLAANGVISYSAEIINEVDSITNTKTKEKKAYVTKAHVFVSVALTDEGKKCVLQDSAIVEEKPLSTFPSDMENAFKNEKYPADAVGAEGEIPERNPVINDEEEKVVVAEKEEKEPTLYQIEKAKENVVMVKVNTMTKTISKVINITATNMMQRQGIAFADVIFETSEVTPFGRILENIVKGEKEKYHFTFRMFENEGWKIINEVPVSFVQENVSSK